MQTKKMASNNERVNPEVQFQTLRRKKIMKYSLYAAAFVVFQTIVITAIALTVMRIKNPKFSFENSTVTFAYGGNTVGEVFIARARARARSTRKIDVMVDPGQIEWKGAGDEADNKEESAQMNCTMELI
ncbi:hypothetical protein CK203_019353 [Vitis vinifera]|uniref:Late embryogenesis abundant protein n=1 Tax=Vitis vinifera TaxID=29760 RepID=A0A438IYR7_VITVI|nr:hypothetical protein CK203_019353 [Vitis vinifera]